MRFYVFSGDDPSAADPAGGAVSGETPLTQAVAVGAYKRWLFDCLASLGEIIRFNHDTPADMLAEAFHRPEAIVVGVHALLRGHPLFASIPRRELCLTLGNLLVPEEMIRCLRQPCPQALLVSTAFQRDRLTGHFGDLFPRMFVFPPFLDTAFFRPPSPSERERARAEYGLSSTHKHILYAGRLVTTKGLTQLLRALSMASIDNAVLSIVGDIDESYQPYHTVARHHTFKTFLEQEALPYAGLPIRRSSAVDAGGLRQYFWSADAFVYPSWSPDENFSITAHQAAACGAPVVVSRLAGLTPLADAMPWGGIDTFPTLVGARFGLGQLAKLISAALAWPRTAGAPAGLTALLQQYSPEAGRAALAEAVRYLADQPTTQFDEDPPRDQRFLRRLHETADGRLLGKALALQRDGAQGIAMYGDILPHQSVPLCQSLFTHHPAPDTVVPGRPYCGFFRLGLWEEERLLMEFGFPGPRYRCFSNTDWMTLTSCATIDRRRDEPVFFPETSEQVRVIQQLVDEAYLVGDRRGAPTSGHYTTGEC